MDRCTHMVDAREKWCADCWQHQIATLSRSFIASKTVIRERDALQQENERLEGEVDRLKRELGDAEFVHARCHN